ncbi:hypothetical protein [Halogeometricum sp. CBA1124]|uniref:hypothetical protein n=1 Tax=Halogeometricum sp. CBA1124 TaxID=2668071 RepID=UPI001E2A9B57|nr:hypothetical protein [Halogeometricum sp. CBA1124]
METFPGREASCETDTVRVDWLTARGSTDSVPDPPRERSPDSVTSDICRPETSVWSETVTVLADAPSPNRL